MAAPRRTPLNERGDQRSSLKNYMIVRVKICGITNLDDALAAGDSGADALGFMLYESSPRNVPVDQVAEIIPKLPPFIAKVGVFVNGSETTVRRIIAECGLDTLQFHGDESPEFCGRFSAARMESGTTTLTPALSSLRNAATEDRSPRRGRTDASAIGSSLPGVQAPPIWTPLKVYKAFRIQSLASLASLPVYKTDAWLLDSFTPDKPGGTGVKFNWELALEAKKLGRP